MSGAEPPPSLQPWWCALAPILLRGAALEQRGSAREESGAAARSVAGMGLVMGTLGLGMGTLGTRAARPLADTRPLSPPVAACCVDTGCDKSPVCVRKAPHLGTNTRLVT